MDNAELTAQADVGNSQQGWAAPHTLETQGNRRSTELQGSVRDWSEGFLLHTSAQLNSLSVRSCLRHRRHSGPIDKPLLVKMIGWLLVALVKVGERGEQSPVSGFVAPLPHSQFFLVRFTNCPHSEQATVGLPR